MDLKESSELNAFRQNIREWTLANLPAEMKQPYRYSGMEDDNLTSEWYRRLGKQGWLAYRWPSTYSGAGFSIPQQVVFADELSRCSAPTPGGFGLSMVGPLILQFGTQAQRERFLPPIARHQEIWCQGYSEPDAGSDLASLQTHAQPDGDHYVINGRKVWTSRADVADWIFVLARTSSQGKPQEGISFFLVDMKTAGISLKPIEQLDGMQGFCETLFEEVRTPATNMVGKIHQGWSMAKALLNHERTSTGESINLTNLLKDVKTIASTYENDGVPLIKDARFRQRLTKLEMDADCLIFTRKRLMSAVMQGKTPGPEASIFKLYQTELCQSIYDLALEILGPDGAAWWDKRLSNEAYSVAMMAVMSRAMSIYAGSNEIQRNIISKHVLQLPS